LISDDLGDDAGRFAAVGVGHSRNPSGDEPMSTRITAGAVVFCRDHRALAAFYSELAGLHFQGGDDSHTVLASEDFELVLHALRGEPEPTTPPATREDSYVKLFFPVPRLAEARARCAILGGRLRPANEEWQARGFRACDGVDPEGNVFQLREPAP
jgi:predicted enzyme related to lactoylglutathione lyase